MFTEKLHPCALYDLLSAFRIFDLQTFGLKSLYILMSTSLAATSKRRIYS